MHGRLQEEVAWTRLLDMQREAENRRLGRDVASPATVWGARFIGELITRIARRALQRSPGAVRDVA